MKLKSYEFTLGEIIGAAAIGASLLFVGLEVRENTRGPAQADDKNVATQCSSGPEAG